MKQLLQGIAIGVAFFGTLGIAQAIIIVDSLPGGTISPMPNIDFFGSGPQFFGEGVTWSSEYTDSVFGYDNGYGFSSNGYWGEGLIMAGTNNSTSTMTFTFATPVTGVGGLINYAPGYGSPVIAAYDSTSTLLETTTLSFSTGGGNNSGVFYGFLETTAQIKYFTLSGAYIGIANLTTTEASPVPEPVSMTLFCIGMTGLIASRRREKGCKADQLPDTSPICDGKSILN